MTSERDPAYQFEYHASPSEARRIWNAVLRRQGLAEDARLTTAVEVAHATLGLHSARLPSPFATVMARVSGSATPLGLFSRAAREEMMTIRCMRRTLHTLPLDLVGMAHGATVHFRERAALRAATNAGVSQNALARATDEIVELLRGEGPLFHRDIETLVARGRRTRIVVRLAIKLAWERGVLVYWNTVLGWNRERRHFALTCDLYPKAVMSLDRETATRSLVEAYFDRYGPASIRDAMWWGGLSRGGVVRALSESGREVVKLQTEWTGSPLYMFRDRFVACTGQASVVNGTGLNFLAHEDVALKAYFETRARYLGTISAGCAFNSIGEVRPTILNDGQLVGTWSWDANTRRVKWRVVQGGEGPALRVPIAQQALEVENTLRLGWVA